MPSLTRPASAYLVKALLTGWVLFSASSLTPSSTPSSTRGTWMTAMKTRGSPTGTSCRVLRRSKRLAGLVITPGTVCHSCFTHFPALTYRQSPNRPASMTDLQRLGVVYWKLSGEEDPKLQAIREVRGYSYKVCAGLGLQC